MDWKKKIEIRERVLKEAEYFLRYKSTIRKTAEYFNISEGTVHNDLTHRLKKIDHKIYLKVKKMLKINKNERNERGGISTKKRFNDIKSNKKIIFK